HFQPVVFALAHADDAAAADVHAGLLHGGDGIHAILERVRADDLGIEFRRGVDVVIVSGDAGFLELARLGERELAERDADFHAELAHFADRAEHLLKLRVAITHALPRRTHAKARRAILSRTARY